MCMRTDLRPVGRDDANIMQGYFALMKRPDNICQDGSLPRIAQGVTSPHLRRRHAISVQEQHSLLWG